VCSSDLLAAGDALAHLGRTEKAEAEFRQEMTRFPQDPRARVGLSTLYGAEGRAREAVGVIEEMLRVAPSPGNYAIAARTLAVIGQPGEAREILARGLQQFPNSRDLRAVATSGVR
jgi:tetratricopeptide (TPR) repeat protein